MQIQGGGCNPIKLIYFIEIFLIQKGGFLLCEIDEEDVGKNTKACVG